MKKLWNSFKVAFSMYSKIPMPYADFQKDSMEYAMCFFPLIGVVIGAMMIGWHALMQVLPFEHALETIGYVVIPLLVTGGIHLDGWIDTIDALKSFQTREKKLEILKDPHIGAFALIYAAIYLLITCGIWSEVNERALYPLAIGYVVSRVMSAFAVVTFPKAKNTGLAAMFSSTARKSHVKRTLILYMIVCFAGLLILDPILGGAQIIIACLVYLYYYLMCKKQFGGMTGDLAGYFLQLCELAMAIVVICISCML